MTQIILMRRCPDKDDRGTGVGWYSDNLESIYADNDTDYKNIYFKLSADEGYFKSLKRGFIEPKIELRNTDALIYHATEELCCLPFPRIKGKKVMTFHHMLKSREGRSILLSVIWKIAAKRAVKYSNAIIAVSEQTKKDIVEQFKADPNKIYVLEHTFDSYFRNLGLERKKIIGYVGTLIKRKNVSAGLRAFKIFTEMPDTDGYRFLICGDGPLKNELKALSKSLEIENRVDFISNLSKEELLTLYNEMAVFANTSLQEGLGLTSLEASACGTPVVFFEDADIPVSVTKNQIPSKNEEEFAFNMHRLVTDEDYRKPFTVAASFGLSREEYSKKLFEIYSNISNSDASSFKKSPHKIR